MKTEDGYWSVWERQPTPQIFELFVTQGAKLVIWLQKCTYESPVHATENCRQPGAFVPHNLGRSVDLLRTLPSVYGPEVGGLYYLFKQYCLLVPITLAWTNGVPSWISSHIAAGKFPQKQSCASNQAWPYKHLSRHSSLLSPHFVSNPCKWAGWFTDLKMCIFIMCQKLCWIMSTGEQGRLQSWKV